jgi:adenine-specific DNA-methyltransferase
MVALLKESGSICWQVGNYVESGSIIPLDYLFHPIFQSLGMTLRNRIVWRFGHGLHGKHRFSGRYEVVLWYTKSKKNNYTFNLDNVRVKSKYPSKRHYKGPNKGQYSSNPLGKNPEDVWDFDFDVWEIPNVKAMHVEKTGHPCQFPVGLVERLILALTNPDDLVFDPFAGVGSAGVAALLHGRRFWGSEIDPAYVTIAEQRCNDAIVGRARYRPHDQPVYDHTRSALSRPPVQGSVRPVKATRTL